MRLPPAPTCPPCDRRQQMLDWWKRLPAEHKLAARMECMKPGFTGFWYFLVNFCWIYALPDKAVEKATGFKAQAGWVQFRPWPGQKRSIIKMMVHWLCLWVKCRQIAATWIACYRTLHTVIFFPNQEVAMISLEGERSKAMARRVLQAWNSLPPGLAPGTPGDDIWSKTLRAWDHPEGESLVRVLSTTEYGSAAYTLTGAVVDEICLIEMSGRVRSNELIVAGVLESLRMMQGWFLGISTGRVKAGWFYRKVMDLAKSEVSPPEIWDDFGLLFNPIDDHPLYAGENYAKIRARHADNPEWIREHPRNLEEAFMAEGLSIFNVTRVYERMMDIEAGLTPRLKLLTFRGITSTSQRPRPQEAHDGECRQYFEPIHGHVYGLAVDPSEGKPKGDFTAIQVLDKTTGDQVMVVEVKMTEEVDIAKLAFIIGKYYNWATIIPEINRMRGVLKELQRLGYPFLYFTTKPGVSAIDTSEAREYGWRTNPGEGSTSKSLMLACLKGQITTPQEERWLKIHDARTLEQMVTFVQTHDEKTGAIKTIGAPPGGDTHDDLVMALGIVTYVAREEPEHFQFVDVTGDGEHSTEGTGAIYCPSIENAGEDGWLGEKTKERDEWEEFDKVLKWG